MAHKVLVVDDEPTLRSTVRAYLERAGYAVQTATDGRSALHVYADFQPDLVVLDIMLPETDGLEVLRRLRQKSDVYVIMLTARVEPLSIAEVETAVNDYLDVLNQDGLALGEIMISDNHAYAQILEADSGQRAFEVLVDPVSCGVFPEPGPRNTEYGMMDGGLGMMGGQYGSGMMGGMMSGGRLAPDIEVNVSAGEAVNIAQEFLGASLPGKTADETADPFPGYYTLHVLEEGETIGMLSVNAYTGQVFVHHWRGEFIEMVGEDHR